jgi:hypothetical protein
MKKPPFPLPLHPFELSPTLSLNQASVPLLKLVLVDLKKVPSWQNELIPNEYCILILSTNWVPHLLNRNHLSYRHLVQVKIMLIKQISILDDLVIFWFSDFETAELTHLKTFPL